MQMDKVRKTLSLEELSTMMGSIETVRSRG